MSRPVLGDLPLVQVQTLTTEEAGAQACDRVPALEGDFVDTLGRRARRVLITGVLSGPTAADDLGTLRAAFRDGVPLSFVADVATATALSHVVLQGFVAQEVAGSPQRVEYALALREHVPAPAAQQRAGQAPTGPVDAAVAAEAQAGAADQVAAVAAGRGTLEVQVELASGANAPDAYAGIVVHVEPAPDAQGDAAAFRAVGTEQTAGRYTFPDVPAGSYQVRVELR